MISDQSCQFFQSLLVIGQGTSTIQFMHTAKHIVMLPLCLPVKTPHDILQKQTNERESFHLKKKEETATEKLK